MSTLILRTTISGQAMAWIHWQQAILLYAKDQVAWTLGDTPQRYYGGINRMSNTRSYRDVHSIVAVKGDIGHSLYGKVPTLTNRALFSRDQHTCLYCLVTLADRHLTRDHVIPVSRGGKDSWTNVVTACRVCNQRKADKLLSESTMRLHAVPYAPNHAEWLILFNRHIQVDQMEFLKVLCPKERR